MSTKPTFGIGVRYEPILDLATGHIGGYAATPHLPHVVQPPLTAASFTTDRTGMLTAARIVSTLAEGRSRPAGTFVLLALGATLVVTPPVRTALQSFTSLDGVVLDIEDLGEAGDLAAVERALGEYRAAGARIAVGGVGSAQSQLSRLRRIEPAFMHLRRDWVRGVDHSDARRSAVEAIRQLAAGVGAQVLAEGVASVAELMTLAELRISLARGPIVGLATNGWADVSPDAASAVRGCTDSLAGCH